MIRRAQLSLNEANKIKFDKLDLVMDEALRVINVFIDELWAIKQFHGSFTDLKTDTWLSARMQQCLGKQALEVVKSQRRKRKKTKPVVKKPVLNLDQRFLMFEQNSNSFDFWITIGSLGSKLKIVLPSKKHKHFNEFVTAGWTLKKSGRLRKTDRGWFLDVYFEKEEPAKKVKGTSIGLDCGYKKLIVCSDGQVAGSDMELTYEKIARKKRGSKAYARALTERDNKINAAVNTLDLDAVKSCVIEGLSNVKKGSKGKIRKQFNNKLQYWSYRKCFAKLQSVCELGGINLKAIDPAYTSQTCSGCGRVDKNSRKGERFLCTRCGISLDADFNASKNILMRGAYSPPSVKAIL